MGKAKSSLEMRQNEVEAILGRGMDVTPIPANDVLPTVHFHLEETFLHWVNPDTSESIDVHFLNGQVVHKRFWKDHEIVEQEPKDGIANGTRFNVILTNTVMG